MAESSAIWTIGHSTRSIDEFVGLLRQGQVEMVVDVRTVPRSRTNPQFNLDTLPAELAERQIGHARIAELGGLRGRAFDVPPDINGWWINQSFHNYADHALSADFATGLGELFALADGRPTAVMCSEAVWWRCHRRIIADYAILHGREVFHLMGKDRVEPATMTVAAVYEGDHLTYPAVAPG